MSGNGSHWSDWSTYTSGAYMAGAAGPYTGTVQQNSEHGSPTPPVTESSSGDTYNASGKPSAPAPATAHIPAPPFPASTLHAPLTVAQRTAVLTYLETWAGTGDPNPSAFVFATMTGQDWKQLTDSSPFSAALLAGINKDYLAGKYDAKAIQMYTDFSANKPTVPPGYQYDTYQTGGLGSLLDWTHYLSTALSWITTASNWKRIGLFALGAIILLLTGYELIK
jgi:hypothetical protein